MKVKVKLGGKEVDMEPLSVEEGEETVELTPKTLKIIESVYVVPPPDRNGELCFIHGEISFSDEDDTSKSAVTLFSRTIDDPQTVHLGDRDFGFLTLAQDPAHDRLLNGLHPIFANFQLCESPINENEDEEDEVIEIADVKRLRINSHVLNETDLVKVEGKCGFGFEMRYAFITGLAVEFNLTINNEIYSFSKAREEEEIMAMGESRKRKSPKCNSVYGLVVACQHMNPRGGEANQRLFSRSRNKPESVPIGSPIPLDRSVVIAPCAPDLLSVAIVLWDAATHELFAQEYVSFPIQLFKDVILTNKQLTHTKHVIKEQLSVSIKFLK